MRFAVRVHGRGVVTQFNGEPITERKTAEQIVRTIDLMYGEKCSIETLVLDLPVRNGTANSHLNDPQFEYDHRMGTTPDE